MISRPKMLMWLSFTVLGLTFVRIFAPISDSLDEILLVVTIPILLGSSGAYFWQERRERQAEQSSGTAISSGDQR